MNTMFNIEIAENVWLLPSLWQTFKLLSSFYLGFNHPPKQSQLQLSPCFTTFWTWSWPIWTIWSFTRLLLPSSSGFFFRSSLVSISFDKVILFLSRFSFWIFFMSGHSFMLPNWIEENILATNTLQDDKWFMASP